MRPITKAILTICVISSCATPSNKTLVDIAPLVKRSMNTVVIATPAQLQAKLPTTTTEVPLAFDAGDFIDEQRNLHGLCGEFHDLAIAVGWTEDQWPKLSHIVHRESRCDVRALNSSDPNGGSRGLMQINGYWCKSVKYNPSGWLQAKGILTTCDDLYNPETNLRAGLAMWKYNDDRGKNGWSPWNL